MPEPSEPMSAAEMRKQLGKMILKVFDDKFEWGDIEKAHDKALDYWRKELIEWGEMREKPACKCGQIKWTCPQCGNLFCSKCECGIFACKNCRELEARDENS